MPAATAITTAKTALRPRPLPSGDCLIQLRQRVPIARGGRRLVYAHPCIDRLVLKVPRPEARYENRQNLRFWQRRFRRFKHYNDSIREAIEHVAAYAATDSLAPFMQQFYGFIETDMGLASVSKAERGRDGGYARNLRQLVQSGQFDAEARAAFAEFCEAFLASNMVAGDLRMENLVYSHNPEDDTMRFVIIDGLGDKNGIKLCSLSPFYNRLSKKKRLRALKKRMALTLGEAV